VIPAAFDYERAESVDQALQLLSDGGEDAKLLAGGHSLLPLMKLRVAAPSLLVDIGRVAELKGVRDSGDHLAIGAATKYEDLHFDDLLNQHCPILAYTAGEVGDPQVRHMGTIGGSVSHGDPASDMPTVLLALDATMVVRGPQGERTVAAADFFQGIFETALGPADLLTEIRVPKTGGQGWAYVKFNPRAQDWAVVGVAVVNALSNGAGTAIALTNMSDRPVRASGVEGALSAGQGPELAAQKANEGTNPPSDPLASAEYREGIAPVLVRRALEQARSR
jgi:aerobic carbon-monoxide dehydrogenase medium subunit